MAYLGIHQGFGVDQWAIFLFLLVTLGLVIAIVNKQRTEVSIVTMPYLYKNCHNQFILFHSSDRRAYGGNFDQSYCHVATLCGANGRAFEQWANGQDPFNDIGHADIPNVYVLQL